MEWEPIGWSGTIAEYLRSCKVSKIQELRKVVRSRGVQFVVVSAPFVVTIRIVFWGVRVGLGHGISNCPKLEDTQRRQMASHRGADDRGGGYWALPSVVGIYGLVGVLYNLVSIWAYKFMEVSTAIEARLCSSEIYDREVIGMTYRVWSAESCWCCYSFVSHLHDHRTQSLYSYTNSQTTTHLYHHIHTQDDQSS